MLLNLANKDYGQSTRIHPQSYYLRYNTTMSRFGQASDAFRSLRSRNVPLARAGLPEERRLPRHYHKLENKKLRKSGKRKAKSKI